MEIKQIFKDRVNTIVDLLNKFTNFILILTNQNLDIIDYTDGLTKVYEIDKNLRGLNLKSLVVNDSEFVNFLEDVNKVFIILRSKEDIELAFQGFVIKVREYYLFLLEYRRFTYNELIVKLSKLNEEIVNKTRELAKRNRELYEAFLKIKKLEEKDVLTGILNRRAFMRVIVKEIKRAKRYKLPLSLAILDIDNFKLINDTYGHEAGDEVLRKICRVVEKNTREHDIFARFGGEEFVLLFPHTNPDEAYLASERLRLKIDKLKFKRISHCVTVSFGITTLKEEDNLKTFIKRADEALYEAKQSGKNRSVIKT